MEQENNMQTDVQETVAVDAPATENVETQEKKHTGFTSKIGFVLAAAGSAVGLGNLWRFPYLTARYGGLFILIYIIFAVTFGFSLLTLEIAIGRKTGKDVVGAFGTLNKKTKWFGFFSLVVPVIIVPYYCVIGGWVMKYLVAYMNGAGATGVLTADYFSSFISGSWEPLIYFLIFAAMTFIVVVFGVQKGIEKVSKILMPLLAIIAVALAIFVLCQPGALEGLKYVFVPNFENFSGQIFLDALGQLFYSMSLAMCIMITYGSYMKKSENIQKCGRQISIFDTGFAIVASLIIIPAIFAFSANPDADIASSGPSLMFITLPNVFGAFSFGNLLGILFFILVLFAALTSSISLFEAIVAVLCKNFKLKRLHACFIVFGIIVVLGVLSSLGFGPLSMISLGGMTILDMFDFISNSVLMPIVAIGTCLIAGYFINTKLITEELGLKEKSRNETYFKIMIRYIVPVCLLAILVSGIVTLFI